MVLGRGISFGPARLPRPPPSRSLTAQGAAVAGAQRRWRSVGLGDMPPGRSYVSLSELRDELPPVNTRRVASALRQRGVYVHISEAKASVYRNDLTRVRELLATLPRNFFQATQPAALRRSRGCRSELHLLRQADHTDRSLWDAQVTTFACRADRYSCEASVNRLPSGPTCHSSPVWWVVP